MSTKSTVAPLLKWPLKTVRTIFLLVGVVSSIRWYQDTVSHFRFPTTTFWHPHVDVRCYLDTLFLFRFPITSFRRPYVDVVVLCITALLFSSVKRRGGRVAARLSRRLSEQRLVPMNHHPFESPPALLDSDPRMKLQTSPLQTSHPVDFILSTVPTDTNKPADGRSPSTLHRMDNQKRSVIPNVMDEATTTHVISPSSKKKTLIEVPTLPAAESPRRKPSGATVPIQETTLVPESSVTAQHAGWTPPRCSYRPSTPRRESWSLQRQSVLLPRTWKAREPEHNRPPSILRDKEQLAGTGSGDTSPAASLPVASAPPWLGWTEEEPEDSESLDATWRAITGLMPLKKREKTWVPAAAETKQRTPCFDKEELCWSPPLPMKEKSRKMKGEEEVRRKADVIFIRRPNTRDDARLQWQESNTTSDQQLRSWPPSATLQRQVGIPTGKREAP